MTAGTGRHLGRALSDILSQTAIKTKGALLPAEAAHAWKAREAFLETMESELAPTLRAAFQHVIDHPDTPEPMRAFFGAALAPEHQGQVILDIALVLGLGLAGPQAAAAGYLQRLQNISFQEHGDLPLTPNEAAEAVVKGALDEAAGAFYARLAGMHGDNFAHLVALTGDPPGAMELLEAFRRGIIDEGRLEHGIRQGRIKNEWVDVVRALRFAPPGAGEVIAAAVEGHLTEAEARERMAQAGVDPANFEWLYETAGRPPGTQEMLSLLNRNLMTEAEVVAGIRESNVKNKYIPAILRMRDHLLPQRSIVSMVRHGALSDESARRRLHELGIDAEAVDALIGEAHHTATAAERELAKSEVVALYLDGMVNPGQARDLLHSLRYSDESITMLLGLAESHRERTYRERAISRVRSLYTGHHVDRPTASADLDSLGVATTERDHLIHLWDLERSANVRMLTEAQVVKAWKASLIDDAEFVRRHMAMGYTEADARLLLTMDGGTPTGGTTP